MFRAREANRIKKLDGPRRSPTSGGPARQLVMLLHGYGANGEDLIGLAPYMARLVPDAAFVSPHAPERCAMQPTGYQWWGIDSFSPEERLEGAMRAAPVLDAFIDAELEKLGLDESSLALIGFSGAGYVFPRDMPQHDQGTSAKTETQPILVRPGV